MLHNPVVIIFLCARVCVTVRCVCVRRFQKRKFDEDAILSDLPLPLQRAIIGHNAADVIKSVPIFQEAHQACPCMCGCVLGECADADVCVRRASRMRCCLVCGT